MQKAELKLILYLLRNPLNVSKNYRTISKESGVSLGSVQANLAVLTEGGYVVEIAGRRTLRKKSRLLDYWARGYAESFKRKQIIGRFRFISDGIKEQWTSIVLKDGAVWGGEPAACLVDGYIRPAKWDVYVEDKSDCLIETGRMIPDSNGEIYVYRKFWKGDGMPLEVVYADLISVGDDRCLEAALRLREKILNNGI